MDNYAESKVLVHTSNALKEVLIFALDLMSDAVKYVNEIDLPEVEDKLKKVRSKIGFKQEVCEKKKQLLSNTKGVNIFKSDVLFNRKSAP